MLKLVDLKKSFHQVEVLKGVNLDIQKEVHLAILGASGSGKTTLLQLIGGLDRSTHGEIYFEGKSLTKLNDQELAEYRGGNVGFVFQHHFLLSTMSALSNILLPARINSKNLGEVTDLVYLLATKMGMDQLLKKFPHELSGGEQQRINLLRALSLRPKLLLCDEPTGNLDSQNGELVMNLLLDFAKEFHSTLIMVTHDKLLASRCDKQILIVDGKIVNNSL